MKIEDLRIVVDEREKKSGIPDLLKEIGAKVEIVTLPIGDYIVGPETIVERKSVNDFISSVFDGRLFDQCTRLKEHYENPVIVIEGNIDLIDQIAENPLVFYGAVATIVLDFRIPIVPTPYASHTAKLLIAMCARKGSMKGPFLKKIRKSGTMYDQQLAILCSLPSIGEKLATRMLERFGSASFSLNASVSDLSKIKGMGKERARKIRKILDTETKNVKETNQKTLHDIR